MMTFAHDMPTSATDETAIAPAQGAKVREGASGSNAARPAARLIHPSLDALESIPAELRQRRQWVLWRNENGRKMPYGVNGKAASSTDPATWAAFGEAVDAYEVCETWSGIGFVFTQDDGLCGVDLDDCRDQDGSLAPAAQKIIDDFASYCEVSPSGRGVKIIARGSKPEGAKCKRPGDGFKEIEIYDRARYFCITGERIDSAPNTIADAQAALDSILDRCGFTAPSNKPELNGSLNGRHARTDDAEARCWQYLIHAPDAISGASGHDKTLRAACECVRFDLDDAATWRIMRRWNDEKSDEKWTDRELRHKIASAQDKAGHERGTRNTARRRKQSVPIPDKPQLKHDGPHELQLTATNARQIGARGKVEVCFDVCIGGEAQSPVTVTTSASSIRDAARELATWTELATGADSLTRHDRAKINQFIGKAMKGAPAMAAYFKAIRQSVPVDRPDGPSMQSIIIDLAPKLAGLTFTNIDGTAWSETLGRCIDFREFERRVPTALVEACEDAIDYPEDRIGLSAPVGTMRQYLGMAWAEALNALPGEVKADTGPDSEAARRYGEAIVRLFTIRERWKKTYARDGSDHALDSATLAQLAREKIDATQQIDTASGWQRIHNSAIDSWYCTTPRLHEGAPTGELPDAWLAFRFELVNQLPKHSRPELPNTRNMVELGIIARRYGLTADSDPSSPISIVKERGKQRRVIVLNRALTDLILWQWDDGNEPDESSRNPDRVTASFENDNPNGDESPLRGQK